MKNIINGFRQLFDKGGGNITKILLLAIGLAAGIILIAKIWLEYSNNKSFKDSDRIYIVSMDYAHGNEEMKSSSHTSGGIAPAIKEYSPKVELATLFTWLAEGILFPNIDHQGATRGNKFSARQIVLADTSFFEMFNTSIIGKNPKESLAIPGNAYISRSFAEKLTGSSDRGVSDNIIGTLVSMVSNPSQMMTICGIYDDFPVNSSLHEFDILLSLPSIGNYLWDGSDNLLGNERYYSFVKLFKNTDPSSLSGDIEKMCQNKLPQEELQEAGVSLGYHISLYGGFNLQDKDQRVVFILLIVLAISVLAVAVLNYVLIAISAMVHKAKMIAVHKCYGALPKHILSMVFSDVFAHLVISLVLASFLILACSNTVNYIMGNDISGLFSISTLVIILGIVIVILLLCALFPGIVYSKIPVASAFRRYKENSRRWKYILLFVQFAASAFFISLLAIIIMQYRYITNANPGYAYNTLFYSNVGDVYSEKKDVIMSEVESLPCVDKVTYCATLPFSAGSGNNIMLEGDPRELCNIVDLYNVGKGYFDLMEIPVLQGRVFSDNASNEVMVSESFVEKILNFTHWQDGVIGKQVHVTEHMGADSSVNFTICGVYKEIVVGNNINIDKRPSVIFSGEANTAPNHINYILVKFKEVTPDNIEAINNILRRISPDGDMAYSYSIELDSQYVSVPRIRDAIMMVGFIIFFITVIGLIGYLQDEINRRRSEMAVRKINGATMGELLSLFWKNIAKLSIPALLIGVVVSYYIGNIILENMSKKIDLHWWIFAGTFSAMVLVISAVIILKTYSAANANPVENLKNE